MERVKMILKFKVVPKSSINKLSWYEKASKTLKLNIKAPPVDGKANKMIIDFLSKSFKTSKKNIRIQSGLSSKLKHIEINEEQKKIENILNQLGS